MRLTRDQYRSLLNAAFSKFSLSIGRFDRPNEVEDWWKKEVVPILDGWREQREADRNDVGLVDIPF